MRNRQEKYQYFNCCVDWKEDDVDAKGGLCEMIDKAITITGQTFKKHVEPKDLEKLQLSLSYQPDDKLNLFTDWAVSFHRSKLYGKRCYYVQHSRIEYIFTQANK